MVISQKSEKNLKKKSMSFFKSSGQSLIKFNEVEPIRSQLTELIRRH